MDWGSDIIKALEDRTASDKGKNLYDSEFFKSHLKYKPIYDFLGDLIVAHFKPKSVIDFGCGCGFLLDRLWRHGIEDVCGIESSSEVKEFWECELANGLISKLSVGNILDYTFELLPGPGIISDDGVRYDMSICMEVAEHISEELANELVYIVSKASKKWIWWTAAVPGQGGTGHINCQPICYWVKKFETFDFSVDWEKTYEIKQLMLQNHAICLGYPWFRDNLLVLRKD